MSRWNDHNGPLQRSCICILVDAVTAEAHTADDKLICEQGIAA